MKVAAICSLDVTDVDYHSFEHGLEKVSSETCGFSCAPAPAPAWAAGARNSPTP